MPSQGRSNIRRGKMNVLLERIASFRKARHSKESSHDGENNLGFVADAAKCNGSDHENLGSGQINSSNLRLSVEISP